MSTEQPKLEKVKPEMAQNFYLTSTLQLLIHTRPVASLLDGTWQHGKMGLKQFGLLTLRLWQAAKQDDPYADWYLIKVYEALQDKKAILQNYERDNQKLLENIRGLEMGLFTNAVPYKYPLNFTTPFGFMGALLLENVDYLHRQLFTLQRLGITSSSVTSFNLRIQVREIFNLARAWHYTGVTRQDIAEGNPKAQKAAQHMGEVPKVIVEREVQLAFLPSPRKTAKSAASA